MKKHFIIMLTLSSVVLLSSALPVNVSAEEGSLPTTIEKPNYLLPYTFDEFLSLTDEEFLALSDIPEEVKEDYTRLRAYKNQLPTIAFRFNNDIELFAEKNSEEAEKEICNILGIPDIIIYSISQGTTIANFPFVLRFNEENYNNYPINEVVNKATIYLKYNDTIADTLIDYKVWTSTQIKGDATGDGEVNILDIISINKAVMGKETLTEAQLQLIDFNQNGKPDADEALTLLKYIVGLISEL